MSGGIWGVIESWHYVIAGGVEGLIVGSIQHSTLKKEYEISQKWIAATTAGFIISGAVLGIMLSDIQVVIAVIYLAIFGAIPTGVIQWYVLREYEKRNRVLLLIITVTTLPLLLFFINMGIRIEAERNEAVAFEASIPIPGPLEQQSGPWTIYTQGNSGLIDNRVTDMTSDALGNIWIGTEGGVSAINGGNWKSYLSDNSDFNSFFINVIEMDEVGRIWVGASQSGIYVFDDEIWTNYSEEEIGRTVSAIAFDSRSRAWLTGWRGITVLDSLTGKKVKAIDIEAIRWSNVAIDDKGLAWVSTGASTNIVIISLETLDIVYSKKLEINNLDNYDIEINKQDEIRLASKGIFLFQDQTLLDYLKFNPYLENENLGPFILDINIDDRGQVWKTTEDGNLSLLDGDSWIVIAENVFNAPDRGTASSYRLDVAQIVFDNEGQIWIGAQYSSNFGTQGYGYGVAVASIVDLLSNP